MTTWGLKIYDFGIRRTWVLNLTKETIALFLGRGVWRKTFVLYCHCFLEHFTDAGTVVTGWTLDFSPFLKIKNVQENFTLMSSIENKETCNIILGHPRLFNLTHSRLFQEDIRDNFSESVCSRMTNTSWIVGTTHQFGKAGWIIAELFMKDIYQIFWPCIDPTEYMSRLDFWFLNESFDKWPAMNYAANHVFLYRCFMIF